MYGKEVHEVLDKLVPFESMYDQIRFVDPIAKKVISYSNDVITERTIKCFDFWGKNKICDNCVSIRAFNENKTFVKIEYTPNKIYMVTAIPIELSNRKIVIELLKDTTDSIVYRNGYTENDSEIYAMIDNMNNLSLKDPLTGVFNRRYINEKLPIDFINAVLSDQSLSIIIADIDFFKKVNDTYGHLTGDFTLKSFTDTISGCIKRKSELNVY
jgi:two-component system, cell cycle response regulator